MLLAISTSGLWRVLWWSLIGAGIVAGYTGLLRAVGVDWVKIRLSVLGAYGAGYVWWFFTKGVIIDRVSVLWSFAIFLSLASLGRPLREWAQMAADLGIFVAMWLAYDESRGIADELGMAIQVESVRNIDRFLFFGTDPVVWLQERFYRGPTTSSGTTSFAHASTTRTSLSLPSSSPCSGLPTATSGSATCGDSPHCSLLHA